MVLMPATGAQTAKRMMAALVLSVVPALALAQSKSDRVIGEFLCKDVMREPGSNRDVVIAFLHGYLLGKSNTSTFNAQRLQQQTDAFVERCLDNPQGKAEDVMLQVKN
jgi:hypothetical protein